MTHHSSRGCRLLTVVVGVLLTSLSERVFFLVQEDSLIVFFFLGVEVDNIFSLILLRLVVIPTISKVIVVFVKVILLFPIIVFTVMRWTMRLREVVMPLVEEWWWTGNKWDNRCCDTERRNCGQNKRAFSKFFP